MKRGRGNAVAELPARAILVLLTTLGGAGCDPPSAPPAPQEILKIAGTVHGTINERTFTATITGTANRATGETTVNVAPIPPELGPSMRITIVNITATNFNLAVALEQDSSVNLLNLTGGNYDRTLITSFPTGEVLASTARVRLTGDSIFTADISYGGWLPVLSADTALQPRPAVWRWRQDAPLRSHQRLSMTARQSYAYGDRDLEANAHVVVTYPGTRRLRFPQMVTYRHLRAGYDRSSETLRFEAAAVVSPEAEGP